MAPEATSRAVVGTLAQGKVLRTDGRTRSARGRTVSSSLAPEAVTVEWTVQDGEVRKPVTGEALTGVAEPGDVAGGGEPSRCREVAAGHGARREGGRTERSEGGGEAHVAEWHRVGAKRVLGDVGRGGGSVPRWGAAKQTG